MLQVENAALVLVDVQTKLIGVMDEKEQLVSNLRKLIQGMRVLEIPILWNEQYPQGLGGTLPELAELLTENNPLDKVCFSCCQNESFVTSLHTIGRPQLLVCGIEAHICVYQTARELQEQGYQVEVVADAVSSRSPLNKQIALKRFQQCNIALTSTEMALFELVKVAKGDQFRAISKLLR